MRPSGRDRQVLATGYLTQGPRQPSSNASSRRRRLPLRLRHELLHHGAAPGAGRARCRAGRRGARPRLHLPGDRQRRCCSRALCRCSSISIPTPSRSTWTICARSRPRRAPERSSRCTPSAARPTWTRSWRWRAEHGVPVVEDAACALGRPTATASCGNIGTLGCFSFHPRKVITTGEGGMITTNDTGSRSASTCCAVTAACALASGSSTRRLATTIG